MEIKPLGVIISIVVNYAKGTTSYGDNFDVLKPKERELLNYYDVLERVRRIHASLVALLRYLILRNLILPQNLP